MTVEKIYICGKCGERFRNEAACLKCEDDHLKVSSVISSKYDYKSSVPSEIEVELDGGYRVRYERGGAVYLPGEDDD